jgi:hypothetical protein
MNAVEFLDMLEENRSFMRIDYGEHTNDDTIRVWNISPCERGEQPVIFDLKWSAIEQYPRATLERKLLKLEPLQPLYQMTRIVGYYSQIRNWNKSKKAELRDRNRVNLS